MFTFRFKVAEEVIEATVLNKKTMELCEDFFTDEEPSVFVNITEEDIARIKTETNKAETFLGQETSNYPSYSYEISALLDNVVQLLLPKNILFLHGSVVAYKGKAYMFTALSGTGKTTHTRLWLKNIPGSYVLNGDKPLLLFKDGKVFVCGSPWMGKEHYGVNEILPLEAICLLERDTKNHISKTTLKDSLSFLFNQTLLNLNQSLITKIMMLLSKLSTVNLYRLGCNMDDEASFVSFNGIVSEEDK